MAHWLFLIPLFPLVAFAINILFGKWYVRERAGLLASVAIFASWVVALIVLLDINQNGHVLKQHLFTWIPAGSFNVEANLYVDQLTAIMLIVVTTVSFLVHVYSIGYMHGDPGYYRFFAYLPLFVFSMLMLVLADNLLVLYVFWEAVGLCSYLLIGFWYKRRSAINAAKKAFIVNRVGDLGFGLGIMWAFWTFGTVAFYGSDGIFARVSQIGTGTMTGIALLLFAGAVGKSAQFPLHVWLPDAMEGPSPVSALIHAATMVTAGVYMVARVHPIFEQSHTAMVVVAAIGAFTAFMAASIAITQNEIKRVIAYSTISQLGYMVFALGSGVWAAGIFHLMTHAFFKGLLFLGAGSIMHGVHSELDVDMRKLGGLRKYMPITFWTFLVAALANAGLVPFSGFWSKDEIISGAWGSGVIPSFGNVVSIVGLAAAFLTALYMFRLVFLTFFGEPRFNPEELHPHESPPVMWVPLVLLAIPAALIGFVGVPPDAGWFHHFLDPVFAGGTGPGAAEAHLTTTTKIVFAVVSTIIALAGIGLAYLIYVPGVISRYAIAVRFHGIYEFLFHKWYFDDLYNAIFVRPGRRLATMLWEVVDIGIIDAAVNGVAIGIGAISQRLRHVQTGLVANYALAIALGMVVLVGIYLAGFSNLFR